MPTTGNLPNPGIEPRFPSLQSDSSPSELLLSRFSHVQLCATPEMAAHQAPPSLGFSRQASMSSYLLLLETKELQRYLYTDEETEAHSTEGVTQCPSSCSVHHGTC